MQNITTFPHHVTYFSVLACGQLHHRTRPPGPLMGPHPSAAPGFGAPFTAAGVKSDQEQEGTGRHTNPDAQLDVLASVHVHARVQETELAEVVPIGHEGAAYHGRSPTMRRLHLYD